ncbi:MAG: NusG domain II-containing protein [Eubacterium sp.]
MKKADLIIIGVVLAIVGILAFFLYYVNGDSGSYVQVEINGKAVETVKLNEDFEKQYDIDGKTNTLVIKDGKASVTQANCPDGICVNHMPIRRSGESIICLPHKFVVTVINEQGSDDEIDAVA